MNQKSYQYRYRTGSKKRVLGNKSSLRRGTVGGLPPKAPALFVRLGSQNWVSRKPSCRQPPAVSCSRRRGRPGGRVLLLGGPAPTSRLRRHTEQDINAPRI